MHRIFPKPNAPLLLFATVLLLIPGSVTGNPQVYERALISVAFIVSPQGNGRAGLGSGTLVNEYERIVLTNYHVVGDRDVAIVFFPAYKGNDLITSPEHYIKQTEKIAVPGKVIARSKDRDLALIKLRSLPRGIHEMPLAARSPKPGETLHAVGNSGIDAGALWRYSKGEVRQVYVRRFKAGPPFIEINARIVETQIPINRGDSGGPVLNVRGELSAVTQGFADDSVQRLVTMMIDISEVRAFLKREKLLPTPPTKKSNTKKSNTKKSQ